MKKLLAFTLPLLLAAVAARADLIWYDGFQYPNGNLTNVSSGVWICPGGNNGSGTDMYVTSHILEVYEAGGPLTPARSSDDYRYLATTSGSPYTNTVQPVYASFTVICTNLPNASGTYFASFYSTSKGYSCRIFGITNGTILPKTWRLTVLDSTTAVSGSRTYPVDLALNTPYQVVAELDPITLFASTIWVNPINPNQTGSSPTETAFTCNDPLGFQTTNQVNSFAFRQASSGAAFYQITNLAVATTFGEAATNVWATNAVPPVIVYQPPTSITRFPTATVSIPVVANGQGLASLNYQWQKSATPDNANPVNVSNANGNSNIYAINGAQTTDDGYYSVVVTTPYGLSVTSAVCQLTILDGPYPPEFTLQPVSQTLFVGQSVTLTTTVLGPPSGGTPVFTWYSNNVVVTAGQVDSGYSSSYNYGSLITNNSATYKVAVTNSFGGIVSSNAVLTVSPVPQVSIAYLRTLVNPNSNYAATNSTLPFQVTGTITTATNLTSGNTSSYYLQDGTAGINIFATFGSTFRPALGDVVTFVGVLSSFSSGLELYVDNTDIPYTTNYANGITAPLPTPVVIPFTYTNNNYAYVNTNLAGRRVQLNGVYFGTNAGTAIASGFLSVTNVSGNTAYLWFSSQDTNTLGNILPAYASSVTGVVFGSQNGGSPNFAVAVTQFSDIVAATAPVLLSASSSGGTINLSWSTPGYSLQGATSPAGPWTTITGTSPYSFTVLSGDPALGSSAAGFYRLTTVP